MVELAISGQTHLSLCRLDLDRPGPHYTADLLDLLHVQYLPSTQFWFLVGEDSLRDLVKWHAPERILASCRLAVYPRAGSPVQWESLIAVIPDIRERIDWLSGPPVACASSQIRRDIRAGRPVSDRLPEAVMAYIERHKLYRA
jgi:nicotinate-nucleotide adenylyltransferase